MSRNVEFDQNDVAQVEQRPSVNNSLLSRTYRNLTQLWHTDKLMCIALLILLFFTLAALFPGLFSTHAPNELHTTDVLAPPSEKYILGTDELGRDVWSRIVHGSRVAVSIAVAAILLASTIGVPLGLISGMQKGLVDRIVMRTMDAILSFPVILLAILLVAAVGASVYTIITVMAIVYIPRFARLVRGNVLTLREREFVMASKSFGASNSRIMFRTLLPNIIPTVLVQASVGLAFTILVEASLSYLGLGVQPPTATWGTMLKTAQRYSVVAPWYVISPGVCIFIIVLVFNFLGDRIRDRLDPRLRGTR